MIIHKFTGLGAYLHNASLIHNDHTLPFVDSDHGKGALNCRESSFAKLHWFYSIKFLSFSQQLFAVSVHALLVAE